MTKHSIILSIRTLCNDVIFSVFSLFLLTAISTSASIMVTGSREEGMAYGLICGFFLGLMIFYYLRAKFSAITTVLQIIINAGLSFGEFFVISHLTENMKISKLSYGYILIFISVPIFLSLNKQLLDNLAKIVPMKLREKQPVQIF